MKIRDAELSCFGVPDFFAKGSASKGVTQTPLFI